MKILLVDNFPLLRSALVDLIGRKFPSHELVVAESLREAVLQGAAGLDLIVTGLPFGEVCREMDVTPGGLDIAAPLIGLDPRPDRRRALRVREAGWRGHVPLDSPVELLGAAMALVAAGGSYFPLLMGEPLPEQRPEPDAVRLSHRQREVLACLEDGKSNREIASELGIAISTVKLHVHTLLSAIGARNRTEVAVRKRRAG